MFDAGVNETLCTRCAHREVCTYKQDFLDIIKAIENATITRDTPDGKITSKKVIHYDFISGISVGLQVPPKLDGNLSLNPVGITSSMNGIHFATGLRGLPYSGLITGNKEE